MRTVHLLMLCISVISGCETIDDTVATSSAPPAASAAVAGAIAGDLASRFAEQNGPKTSAPIVMRKDNTEFANALEAALKGWGYSVITDGRGHQPSKSVALSYSLHGFDNQILAKLATPTIALGRTYDVTTGGATPSSPLSVMRSD